jgi:DNA-binding NtrC family response regulator
VAQRLQLLDHTTAQRPIIGDSAAMCQLREHIEVAAACDEPVLIVGETGTGKELVARAIHARSRRAAKPLSIVNCAAIAADLISAELFGHVAGAFTGASHNRAGRLTAASGSSVFLDEISATSTELQVAFLRAVEYGEVQPVGADGPAKQVDVRYIAASNTSFEELRNGGGGLRRDLFYRLAGIVIEIPALSHRKEDIPALAVHFLEEACEDYGRRKSLSNQALDELIKQTFTGNVRQLRQTIRRTFASCEEHVIQPKDLGDPYGSSFIRKPAPKAARSSERDYALQPMIRQQIVRALVAAKGNLSEGARLLDMPRSTLQHHLVKHRIAVDAVRRTGGERQAAAPARPRSTPTGR